MTTTDYYPDNPEAGHLWDEVRHPETVAAEWAWAERQCAAPKKKSETWRKIRKPFNRSVEARREGEAA